MEILFTSVQDYDLETDVNKLRSRPELDRPEVELGEYEAVCPELSHNFQELDSESKEEKKSEDRTENLPSSLCRFIPSSNFVRDPNCRWRIQSATEAGSDPGEKVFKVPLQSSTKKEKCSRCLINEKREIVEAVQNANSYEEDPTKSHIFFLYPLPKEAAWYKKIFDPECEALIDPTSGVRLKTSEIMANLLEEHQGIIPFHSPHFCIARAKCTKSIPAYGDLAFPDFWGHQPPPYSKPMLEHQYGVQRNKVLDDIHLLIPPGDLIGRTVFDLDEPRFEYDLIMNADLNTNQHHQWFYFGVCGMKLAVPYCFNIINCEKLNSQFNDVAGGVARGRCYYTLTFSIKFPDKDDFCYLACHYPYTYSAMMFHLDILEQSRNPKKIYWRQQVLCQTLGGNPCPLLTITAMPESKESDDLEQF
ncbi:hypothetical protein ASZ78_006878, partial [Callipepla squamata]